MPEETNLATATRRRRTPAVKLHEQDRRLQNLAPIEQAAFVLLDRTPGYREGKVAFSFKHFVDYLNGPKRPPDHAKVSPIRMGYLLRWKGHFVSKPYLILGYNMRLVVQEPEFVHGLLTKEPITDLLRVDEFPGQIPSKHLTTNDVNSLTDEELLDRAQKGLL